MLSIVKRIFGVSKTIRNAHHQLMIINDSNAQNIIHYNKCEKKDDETLRHRQFV